MTQERFLRIVDDPDLLRTITYEELKTLALAYPYAHNLRYFLAIKARQIDHPDVVKNVATAAAYSIDRTQLFRLVAPQMIAPQEVWMEEEILELKPIETLKRKLEEELSAVARTPAAEVPKAEAAAAPVPTPEPAVVATPEPVLEKHSEPEEEIPAIKITYQTFAAWIESFAPPVLEPPAPAKVETMAIAILAPMPTPIDTPLQKSDNQIVDDEDAVEPETTVQSKPQGIAQVLAEKSVAENKDVISETLAKLYAKQGYREKSITMYERLSLAFPEKSAYFAAEIDKLKK
jgi:hypothetical protein